MNGGKPKALVLTGDGINCEQETAHAFRPTELLGIYLSRFQRATTGEDITYLRFAFRGELGAHDPTRSLDHGIVRTLWMTPDEIRASAARHRSPLLLRCMEEYLAGVRYPLSLIYTDPSVTDPRRSAAMAEEEEEDA